MGVSIISNFNSTLGIIEIFIFLHTNWRQNVFFFIGLTPLLPQNWGLDLNCIKWRINQYKSSRSFGETLIERCFYKSSSVFNLIYFFDMKMLINYFDK